ncbi:MAG: Asp-tRNA(Asn)/Glu-tRNA(Gln) amidotransferase subunit GatB [Candidatus Dormibacterales bacterium]
MAEAAGGVPAGWEAVVGMEVHVQLRTRSKMFCPCSADYLAAEPNSNVCPVCLGMPGMLPVVNKVAVERCVLAALALGCQEIPEWTKFDRKNYFYPDLPKGYQISQYDLPMARRGRIEVAGREVRITRVHLEEDTGKLIHEGDQLALAGRSSVDLNRAGVPLMEIVSEPDLRSAGEARGYAVAIREIMRGLGVSEADMEKGQLRAEANVSVRRAGAAGLGVKTELKNINSFRALARAVQHEIDRQTGLLAAGGEVVQETRGWSEKEQRTFSQRRKEFADDYRYFPEPDLPPLRLQPGWVDGLRASLPELPQALRQRLERDHGLPAGAARILAEEPSLVAYITEAGEVPDVPALANLVIQEVRPIPAPERPPPAAAAQVFKLLGSGAINRDQARVVLRETGPGRSVEAVVKDLGLTRLGDEGELAAVVERVLEADPQAAADYRAGKRQALGALVQAVKEATGGRADLKLASGMLRERLGS